MSLRRIEFIVEADEPALFFRSKRDVETSLEAIDVEEGIYPVAFDRDGRVYDIVAIKSRVSLVPDSGGKRDVERLRLVLTRFLAASNVSFSDDETTEALLAKCEPYL